MRLSQKIWRGTWFVLLFFISISCQSNGRTWVFEQNDCCYARYSCSRIILPATDPSDGIELEITQNSHEIRAYINSITLPITPSNPKDHSIEIAYTIDNEEHIAYGQVFEGGQRILLFEEDKEKIISSLTHGKDIVIHLGFYNITIPSEGFASKYQKMM